MQSNIVIYTNPKHTKTIELYNFFKSINLPIQLNPEVKSIKNSLVYINGFNKNLLNLNSSNRVIFLCRGSKLNNSEKLLLPIINSIVAHTNYDAMSISLQLKQYNYNTRVVSILPWSEKHQLNNSEAYCEHIPEEYKNLFNSIKTQNVDKKSKILLDLKDDNNIFKYYILEGMLSGAVPIVLDHPKYSEFIIDGHNGFKVKNSNDIVNAFKIIDKNYEWLSLNAKNSISSLMNKTVYMNKICSPEFSFNFNNFDKVNNFQNRTWLIRDKTVKNGVITYYPQHYHKSITTIDLYSINEILSYFVNQEFSNVYIFGCYLPEDLTVEDELNIKKNLIKLGSRALKIHFCTDDIIPTKLNAIFQKLSILSVEEGIKNITQI